MTVNQVLVGKLYGIGGEAQLSQIREDEGLQFLLEVERVGPEHVDLCLEAGVDVLVAGTAYYKRNAAGRRDFAQIVGER